MSANEVVATIKPSTVSSFSQLSRSYISGEAAAARLGNVDVLEQLIKLEEQANKERWDELRKLANK